MANQHLTPELHSCRRVYESSGSLLAAADVVIAAGRCRLSNGLAHLHEEAAVALHRFALALIAANDLAMEIDLTQSDPPPPAEGA